MISSSEIANNYISIGEKKGSLPFFKMMMLSIMAGMFIAFAGLGATIASCTVQNASLAKLIAGCVFPAGLAMVVLTGAELFTGNSLMVMSLLNKKLALVKLLKSWLVVYVGNLIGGIIVSLITVYGHTLSMFDDKLVNAVVNTASAKCSITFVDGVLRGIACNILVCLAVIMAMASKSAGGKIVSLFFPIMVFVVCGFEHSVANMFYIPAGIFASYEYGVVADNLNWVNFFVINEIPVTLGNIIGGSSLGVVYWALYVKKGSE